MKTYVKLIASLPLLVSCEASTLDSSNCSNGKVIGPQECTVGGSENLYLVQLLDSDSVGDTITYYDGQIYQNVVEAINLPDQYKEEQTLIEFQYELQNPKTRLACTAMSYIFDVPQITIHSICRQVD